MQCDVLFFSFSTYKDSDSLKGAVTVLRLYFFQCFFMPKLQSYLTYLSSIAGARAIRQVSGHQYRWLGGGYDLEIGHF